MASNGDVGILGAMGGRFSWLRAIFQQVSQRSLVFWMHRDIPSQNTVTFALSSMPVVPWWAECRLLQISGRSDGSSTLSFSPYTSNMVPIAGVVKISHLENRLLCTLEADIDMGLLGFHPWLYPMWLLGFALMRFSWLQWSLPPVDQQGCILWWNHNVCRTILGRAGVIEQDSVMLHRKRELTCLVHVWF